MFRISVEYNLKAPVYRVDKNTLVSHALLAIIINLTIRRTISSQAFSINAS